MFRLALGYQDVSFETSSLRQFEAVVRIRQALQQFEP